MEERIIEIIAKVLDVPVADIELDTAVGDLAEWDSLHHVAIIAELEETFGIKFEQSDLQELEDVSDIIALVKEMV